MRDPRRPIADARDAAVLEYFRQNQPCGWLGAHHALEAAGLGGAPDEFYHVWNSMTRLRLAGKLVQERRNRWRVVG